MALPRALTTRETRKFTQNSRRKVAVRTVEQYPLGNTVAIAVTTVGTSAVQIEFPEEGNDFIMYHVTAATNVWLGPDDTITAAGAGTAPLPPQPFSLELHVFSGNDNEIYGIVSSGTVDVYVVGIQSA